MTGVFSFLRLASLLPHLLSDSQPASGGNNRTPAEMLKPYDKQEDVPEALREHYSKRDDGKWHADISNDHPAVKHNATLLSEKNTAISERDTARSELESAKASNLPRGHVAVTKEEEALLTAYKPLGTPDELKTIKTEHETLKTSEASRLKQDKLKLAASASGYNPDKVAALDDRFPEVLSKEVTANGKTTTQYYFKVKDGDKEVEKSFADYVTTEEKLKPLADSLKGASTGGTPYPPQPAGGSAPAPDKFEEIRKNAKAAQEAAAKNAPSIQERFGIRSASA